MIIFFGLISATSGRMVEWLVSTCIKKRVNGYLVNVMCV